MIIGIDFEIQKKLRENLVLKNATCFRYIQYGFRSGVRSHQSSIYLFSFEFAISLKIFLGIWLISNVQCSNVIFKIV
jgi:hypothetical protein